MKFSKDFLFNVVKNAVLLTIMYLVMQHFFFGPKKQADVSEQAARSGQQLAAAPAQELEVRKPLNTEIDFLDAKPAHKTVTTEIETADARYQFSSAGAALQAVEFRRNWGGSESYLSTILPGSSVDKETRCFLVGLKAATPYYFELVDHKKETGQDVLVYKAAFDAGTITKQFTVFHDKHQIDLQLTVAPKAGESLEPRIFFPSPLVPDLISQDSISGFVNNERGNLVFHERKSEETIASYWLKPTIFGTQDRYFAHALVTDPQNFAQRAFYKAQDLHSLYSIVEGPAVTEPTTWDLSFYIGPKTSEAILKVDQRLEQTLYTGWWSPITKPLAKILLLLLNWLYGLVHNYGLAIIILTILMRLVLLPFTWRTGKGKVDKHQEFQKKMQYIQQRYKDDPQRLAAERAELIKKYGFPMPGGAGGCLVMFLQIPMFIALSMVLSNAIELYKASFLWIPDLTARDPYYILALLTGGAMFLHTPIKDPQQRVTAIVTALIVGAISSNFSAGIALYIFVSTALAVVQNQTQELFKR